MSHLSAQPTTETSQIVAKAVAASSLLPVQVGTATPHVFGQTPANTSEVQYPATWAISQMWSLYVMFTRPNRKFAASTSSWHVRGAGKGSVRRKKKAIHKTTTTD